MDTPIEHLTMYTGKYLGEGINHDGQPFKGELEICSILDNKALSLNFVASGADNSIYHKEETLIAPSETGSYGLWTINNNVPYLYKHEFLSCSPVSGADATFKFLHNDPNDSNNFREEIAIDLWADGDISYRYSWGMPGGEYRERSGLRLKKV